MSVDQTRPVEACDCPCVCGAEAEREVDAIATGHPNPNFVLAATFFLLAALAYAFGPAQPSTYALVGGVFAIFWLGGGDDR